MTGLAMAEVLAAHRRTTWAERPFSCACDPDTRDGRMDHTAHVAAAVTAWLAERLASEEVREAVDAALEGARETWFADGDLPSEYRPYTDAALAAVVGALAGES